MSQHSTTDTPNPMTDMAFLEWLDRFIGDWSLDGAECLQVRRRSDGWLFTLDAASLARVIREGTKTADAPGPLGPRPVVLSQSLMQRWLSPEECGQFRYAYAVSSGMRILVETLERRINEVSADERRRILKEAWIDTPHDDPWPREDQDLRAELWATYTGENGSASSKSSVV